MYTETSSNNHGNILLLTFEQTDIIQVSKVVFYCNRFSFITNDSLKT